MILLRDSSRIMVIMAIVGCAVVASTVIAQETGTSPEEGAVVHEVRIPKGADKFNPSVLTIKVGEAVTWINDDDRGHPVASIPGQGTNDKELFSQPIAPGKSWSHTFQKAGEYPYFCYIHYVMMGAIIVEGDQGQTK